MVSRGGPHVSQHRQGLEGHYLQHCQRGTWVAFKALTNWWAMKVSILIKFDGYFNKGWSVMTDFGRVCVKDRFWQIETCANRISVISVLLVPCVVPCIFVETSPFFRGIWFSGRIEHWSIGISCSPGQGFWGVAHWWKPLDVAKKLWLRSKATSSMMSRMSQDYLETFAVALQLIQAVPSFPSSFSIPFKGDQHLPCLSLALNVLAAFGKWKPGLVCWGYQIAWDIIYVTSCSLLKFDQALQHIWPERCLFQIYFDSQALKAMQGFIWLDAWTELAHQIGARIKDSLCHWSGSILQGAPTGTGWVLATAFSGYQYPPENISPTKACLKMIFGGTC